MNIAVISDIHANLAALKAVVDDIEQFKPDMIFCLGDYVMAGYNPNGTMEFLFELKQKFGDNFKMIQGNTDKMVAYCSEELLKNSKEAYPCMGYSLEEDVKITEKNYIEFIKNLPEKMELEICGLKIELVHGSPRRQNENIYPGLTENTVEEMVASSKAELILCGHTHKPAGYSLSSGKTVVNVGSVGRSMIESKMPVYLQLTVDKNGQFFTEHRVVNYDNKEVFNHILTRNFPHCRELAEMFL